MCDIGFDDVVVGGVVVGGGVGVLMMMEWSGCERERATKQQPRSRAIPSSINLHPIHDSCIPFTMSEYVSESMTQ